MNHGISAGVKFEKFKNWKFVRVSAKEVGKFKGSPSEAAA
jgi:hypothetical protein